MLLHTSNWHLFSMWFMRPPKLIHCTQNLNKHLLKCIKASDVHINAFLVLNGDGDDGSMEASNQVVRKIFKSHMSCVLHLSNLWCWWSCKHMKYWWGERHKLEDASLWMLGIENSSILKDDSTEPGESSQEMLKGDILHISVTTLTSSELGNLLFTPWEQLSQEFSWRICSK